MARPVVYGADYSVYVRIVRLTLHEKGVDYDLAPVDIFAPGGPPGDYLERHPFGRIPAFEHDGFRMYETGAIIRYVDEAFSGPPLQPDDARPRAVMNQITGLLDAYAYRPMVWDVAVERLERRPPDEKRIAEGLRRADIVLRALTALKQPGAWMLGDRLTLADLHAAPILAYFRKVPEGQALLSQYSEIEACWTRLAHRPSFAATEKAA